MDYLDIPPEGLSDSLFSEKLIYNNKLVCIYYEDPKIDGLYIDIYNYPFIHGTDQFIQGSLNVYIENNKIILHNCQKIYSTQNRLKLLDIVNNIIGDDSKGPCGAIGWSGEARYYNYIIEPISFIHENKESMIYKDFTLYFYRLGLNIDAVSFKVGLHNGYSKPNTNKFSIHLGQYTILHYKKHKFIIRAHRLTKHIHPCLHDDMFILLKKMWN